MIEHLYQLEKCNDPRGKGVCFASAGEGGLKCSCLGDTKTVPCPFFKPIDKVLEEDPNYYHNLQTRANQLKSYRKNLK